MNKGSGFNPTEIIFSVTDKCNLRCSHCFVQKDNHNLDIDLALKFLDSAYGIDKIGFSGGEPFLNIDFICELSKAAVKKDLMFDRIMTNGDWWNTTEELQKKLKMVYDSGFDGKIGLSFDSFHNQKVERIITFIKTVYAIWNDFSILEIQSVISQNKYNDDIENFIQIAKSLNAEISFQTDKKSKLGMIFIENEKIYLPVTRTPQTFLSNNPNIWKSKKWFKDDFCEGPGQILFIHPNGSIAPCCGFANEEPALQIGTVDFTFEQVIQNAKSNILVEKCYNQGLFKEIKNLKKSKIKLPGKCNDICAFCQFLCNTLYKQEQK